MFSVSGVNLVIYDWVFFNLIFSIVVSLENVFQEIGLFIVVLIVVDVNGCIWIGGFFFEIEICEEFDFCLDNLEFVIEGDSVVCLGDVVIFFVFGLDSIVIYDWNLDVVGSVDEFMFLVIFEENGIYSVVLLVVDEVGCMYSDNFSFEVCFCELDGGCVYVLFNVFLLNGDGINDIFELFCNCLVVSFEFWVFNCWGGIVFEMDDLEIGWDGCFNGQDVFMEVYFY